MPKMISSLSLSAALLFSAEAQEPTLPRMELSTDKACYLPGEMVHLTASGTPPSALSSATATERRSSLRSPMPRW